jgi:hypothetical protein
VVNAISSKHEIRRLSPDAPTFPVSPAYWLGPHAVFFRRESMGKAAGCLRLQVRTLAYGRAHDWLVGHAWSDLVCYFVELLVGVDVESGVVARMTDSP